MWSKAILATVLLLATTATTPSLAQRERDPTADSGASSGATTREEAACRRDARKFCRHVKPEDGNAGFLSCLQEHRAALSKACRGMLEEHNL